LGFCLDVFASLILGTCFSSSSIGVIIVTLRELEVKSRIKSTIISAMFIEDVSSLVLLAVFLHAIMPVSPIPLPLFPVAIFLFLVIVF
jgi:Kef-type K+ transport system membrane component KefB